MRDIATGAQRSGLVGAVRPQGDAGEVDGDRLVDSVCGIAAHMPEDGAGMDHSKACLVLIFTQPSPCNSPHLRQLGYVLCLIAAVVHKERSGAGLAIPSNERASKVVDLLEWREQDDTGEVKMKNCCVLQA